MKRALFLDRDGVIIEMRTERGPKEVALHPEEVQLVPEIEELLAAAKAKGWLLIVVSNQPDVAKGKASLRDIQDTMQEMVRQLCLKGATLKDIRYCLHHPDVSQVVNKAYLKECDCRKPEPGMIIEAARIYDIDVRRSYLIGNASVDIEAGKRAGCKTILLRRDAQHDENEVKPDFVVSNLGEAADLISRVD